jgi:hypothetical protein
MELAIPKLRSGSYFPDWLLERGRRAERALTTVVATCCLLGVSTRRMEKLVETLGITRLSKSQVSVMAKELDEQVESFRSRPPHTTGSSMPSPRSSPRSPNTSTPPEPTSWRSPRSPRRSGDRSGRTTPTGTGRGTWPW